MYQIISKDLIQRVMGKGREGGGVGERADVSSKNREGSSERRTKEWFVDLGYLLVSKLEVELENLILQGL